MEDLARLSLTRQIQGNSYKLYKKFLKLSIFESSKGNDQDIDAVRCIR